MYTKPDIDALLEKLHFFSAEEVALMRKRMLGAIPEALEEIGKTLEEALAGQDVFIRKMVEADPEFPEKTRTFAHDAFVKIKQEEESHEKGALETLGQTLDQT